MEHHLREPGRRPAPAHAIEIAFRLILFRCHGRRPLSRLAIAKHTGNDENFLFSYASDVREALDATSRKAADSRSS